MCEEERKRLKHERYLKKIVRTTEKKKTAKKAAVGKK
jgi:hypothetical protein